MKRFNILFLALVAALTLATSACKKETDPVQPGSNTPAFVGKKLVMTSFQVNPAVDLDGDGEFDPELLVFQSPCDRDNTITFEKNGKLSGSNGELSCSSDQTDPSVVKTSTWTYNEQTRIIRLVRDNDLTDVSEWKVVEASASGLKVNVDVTEPTRSYVTTMVLKAI